MPKAWGWFVVIRLPRFKFPEFSFALAKLIAGFAKLIAGFA
jgi:hypothetical protein